MSDAFRWETEALRLTKELATVRIQLATARAEATRLREHIGSMDSYLQHQDQDANHEWMHRKMREALATAPAANSDEPHRAGDPFNCQCADCRKQDRRAAEPPPDAKCTWCSARCGGEVCECGPDCSITKERP